MTQVIIHDQLPENYYVYRAVFEGDIVYIGMGQGDRYKHLNSGTSHLYSANKAHFDGKCIQVEFIKEGLSKDDAAALEMQEIKEYQPSWNSTYTWAFNMKIRMSRAFNNLNAYGNISSDFALIVSIRDGLDGEYCSTITNKRYKELCGLSLNAFINNFNSSKRPHKFISSLSKVGCGEYKVQLNKKFFDNFELNIKEVKLTRERRKSRSHQA